MYDYNINSGIISYILVHTNIDNLFIVLGGLTIGYPVFVVYTGGNAGQENLTVKTGDELLLPIIK